VPDPGVGFLLAESPEANFQEHYGDNWDVRRNTKLTLEIALQIGFRAQYYIGQKYNPAFLVGGPLFRKWRLSHSFCSELIARIYEDMKQPITQRRHEKVLPVHLELATRDRDVWTDVKEDYKKCLPSESADEHMCGLSEFSIRLPDPREIYVWQTQRVVSSAQIHLEIAASASELELLAKEFVGGIGSLSSDDLRQAGNAVGVRPRSYKDLRATILETLLIIDAQISNSTVATEPYHFTVAAGPQIPDADPKTLLDTCQKAVRATVQVLSETVGVLQYRATQLMKLVALRIESPESPELDASIDEILATMFEVLAVLEDFEDYDEELAVVERLAKERISQEPLVTSECLELVRSIARETRHRQTIRIGVRPQLLQLRESPLDVTCLLELSEALVSLTPSSG